MGQPQSRHRPRSATHDTTGTLSRGRTGAPHDGQCDGGCRIDSPFGTRAITTFANEPSARPRANARTRITIVAGAPIASILAGALTKNAGRGYPARQMAAPDFSLIADHLTELWDRDATDLLLTVGSPPLLRIDGVLVPIDGPAIDQ